MEFKIDTSFSYTLITPLTELLHANLTESIQQKQGQLGQSVSQNLIIDLSGCSDADKTALPALVTMHKEFCGNGRSLVFIGLRDNMIKKLQTEETETTLNIVPTLAEAIDIVNMEILERDLFNEE
jgi:anti-anti-sigma regulatory factor